MLVLLAGMPDSIPGSWLGMDLGMGSTVGGESTTPMQVYVPVATSVATLLLLTVIHLLARAATTSAIPYCMLYICLCPLHDSGRDRLHALADVR